MLIIDDEEAEANATKVMLGDTVCSLARIPDEVSDQDLRQANVTLIDFKLDRWETRDEQETPSLQPRDGVALAAVLRSNLFDPGGPTAFALRSGKLEKLGGALGAKGREHVIAAMLDLDWAFPKQLASATFARQVHSLADAVEALPRPWPNVESSRVAIAKLLKVSESAKWKHRALDDVQAARPPEDALAQATRGMAVLRWMLHQVLPYPTFLLDARYLAARLHANPADFRSTIEGSSAAAKLLKPFEYRGVLHDFLGTRWWKAGIDSWLWQQTNGHPWDRSELEKVLRGLSLKLEIVPQQKPVVVIGENYRPTDDLIDLSDAVEVMPDDWPKFADPAWVSLQNARKNPALRALVRNQDIERISANAAR